jgi:hypothetical protein
LTDFKYASYELAKIATSDLIEAAPQFAYGTADKDKRKAAQAAAAKAPPPAKKDAAAKDEESDDEYYYNEDDWDDDDDDGKPPTVGSCLEENFHHSSLLAGAPVAAAGEIRCKNGVIELISNSSGHYKPPVEYVKQVFLELRDRGYDFQAHPALLEDASHGATKSKAVKVDRAALFTFTKEIVESWHKKVSRSKPAPAKDMEASLKGEEIKAKTVGLRVKYLSPAELKKHEVKVENKLLKLDGKPLDTYGGLIYGLHPVKDRWIFVMSPTGEIYVAEVWTSVKWKPKTSQWVPAFKEHYQNKALFEREPV